MSMTKPTVAIVGASADRRKFGNKAVRAFLRKGYDVFPVNPRESQIEGITVYAWVSSIPQLELDAISIYLPPELGLRCLEELAAKNAKTIWLNPGTESRELLERARQLSLPVVQACSILAIGENPSDFDP
jgi:predicted CoA-binding protein